MRRDYDETFDWGGFNAGIEKTSEEADAFFVKKMRDDYNSKYHASDFFTGVGSLFSSLGGLGGGAAKDNPETAAASAGASLFGGMFGALGSAMKKEDDKVETDNENKFLEGEKLARSKAATNQAYGMSLRNSGI